MPSDRHTNPRSLETVSIPSPFPVHDCTVKTLSLPARKVLVPSTPPTAVLSTTSFIPWIPKTNCRSCAHIRCAPKRNQSTPRGLLTPSLCSCHGDCWPSSALSLRSVASRMVSSPISPLSACTETDNSAYSTFEEPWPSGLYHLNRKSNNTDPFASCARFFSVRHHVQSS